MGEKNRVNALRCIASLHCTHVCGVLLLVVQALGALLLGPSMQLQGVVHRVGQTVEAPLVGHVTSWEAQREVLRMEKLKADTKRTPADGSGQLTSAMLSTFLLPHITGSCFVGCGPTIFDRLLRDFPPQGETPLLLSTAKKRDIHEILKSLQCQPKSAKRFIYGCARHVTRTDQPLAHDLKPKAPCEVMNPSNPASPEALALGLL